MKKFIAFLLLFVCAFVFIGCNKQPAGDVMPTSIKINETNVTVEVDKTVTLSVTIEPENVSSKLVEWNSDNTAVATVSATGKVKGISAGKAKITVTCKADSKISASIEVTVTGGSEDPIATLEKIDIVGPAQVSVGGEATLTINATPANASKEVTWASDNEAVLTVDANGKVTGVAEGSAKVTATSKADATKTAEKTIEVVAGEVGELQSISISATQSYAIEGETIKLTAVATPEGADNSVTWTSSDPEIATIDEEGNVSALTGCESKEVTFTATSTVNPSITATRKISIVALADVVYTIGLTINNVPSGNKLALNKTVQLGHTSTGPVDPATSQNLKVTNTSVSWEVSDETVATIEDGLLTPVAAGEVTVTITALDGSLDDSGNPLQKSVTITIYEPKAPTTWTAAASRDISNGFEFGKDLSIKITVGDEEDATATFTSSNEAVATIDENGKITSVAEGEVTFTATSTLDPTKTATVTVKFVEKIVIDDTPTSISVSGENELYVGYSISLTATVSPLTAVQSVVWTSSDETIATVDQNGKVTALKAGTVRIKVTSTVAKTVYCNFKLSITVEPEPEPYPNMGGYEIIIMNAESALTDNDPFLDGYSQPDKTFKQQAWREVEENFNCKIKVVAYPASAPWGNARITWIMDNAAANTSQCDLGIISSNWIYKFADGAAVDVTRYYSDYGKKQMEPAQKQAGTYKNKLYTASTGTSQTGTSVDLGLFYNLGWLEELGLEDPATMFNEGRWTYTNFEAWVMSAQAKIGDESQPKRALGGHPYYFYYGMTNAAGVKIADSVLVKTNISSQASKNAGALIWKLTDADCVNTTATWAESAGEADFLTGDVLMTTGFLWFVRTDNRWKKDMWGDDTRFGYVPFPYPDDVAKEDTRIGVSGLSVYLYVSGRPYPAGVTSKDVYRAMNEMFLNTIKYQEADDNFDPYSIKYNSLKSRIDNPASIEAIMFYDSSKVFYDPAHSIYDSIAATVLKSPCVYVMYQGKDYDESFDAVAESYESLFKQIYS